MDVHPFEPRVPTRSDSSQNHDDTPSRASISIRRWAKLTKLLARVFRAWSPASLWVSEEPIRAELFGIERRAQHARDLAAAQRTASKLKGKRQLDARLRNNEKALRAAYRATAEAVRAEWTITPAANWLLDNFHVIEEQVWEIRVDLPPSFYRQLPKLIDGPFDRYPRVLGLAWTFVAHTDSHFDPEMLRRFATAYQRVQPLTIGELWAIPITLRILLVENLRRLADDIVGCQAARQEAAALADQLLEARNHEAAVPDIVLRRVERPLRTAFAVQLIRRLCDHDPNEVPALHWLYERLAGQGTTADDIVREEHMRQGAVNVTVRNIITSMHLMSVVDWKELTEDGSHGLPLIGTGDWNDGLNRVGEKEHGESIWLGWFLHATLTTFARLADGRDEQRASNWRRHTAALAEALERDGWDGDWYRRAYYDDGTSLGSASNSACRIDSIAQSWSVISGVANPIRCARAMAEVEKYLVHRDDGLVLFFTPPFDQAALDPGYIKAYPPGIRENGGQYTHAAIWSVIAFAMLGEGDKASELFSMLNPINHATTPSAIQRYKVEPYVACADVYSSPTHVGRGGWTWYTGSAGWMYRAGLESILGFRLQDAMLVLDPCIPTTWPSFGIQFRHHSARYDIRVENPHGVSRGIVRAELDDVALSENQVRIPLADDGASHRVRIVLG